MSHLLTGVFRQETHKKTAGVKRDYNRLGNHYRSLVKWILRVATDHQVGVRFSQDRPRGIGIVGNTSDLHSEVIGSNPISSTIVLPL